ncbi:Tryptophan--tRNA ligase [subsurface metagenome]
MTQFKEKAAQNRKNVNAGLLNYPVLQAADILLYKAEIVPIGQDQVQHVEFTREIARNFNSHFGPTFPECQARLTNTPRIMGLDGESKMSKSKGNYIGLLEKEEEIWKKLSVARTDPARVKRNDPGTPGICNIFDYHRLVTPEPQLSEYIARGCRAAAIGCLDCKEVFLKNLMVILDPVREKYDSLQQRREYVRRRLDENAEYCRSVAKKTILEVKEKMGLTSIWKI